MAISYSIISGISPAICLGNSPAFFPIFRFKLFKEFPREFLQELLKYLHFAKEKKQNLQIQNSFSSANAKISQELMFWISPTLFYEAP